MKHIEVTIQPYSYKREEVQVGEIVDGKFVQKKGIWNVLKDSRLIVKRFYEGRGAQQEVTFSIDIPENYPLAIAVFDIAQGVNLTSRTARNTILYNPAEEAAKVQMSGFFAALASFVEQDAERVQQSRSHFIIEQSFKMEQVVPSPEEVLEFIKVNRPDVVVSLDEVRRAMEILEDTQQ